MKKLWISSAVVLSCLLGNSFANTPSYTSVRTMGKHTIVASRASGALDLTALIKQNHHLAFAIKDPKSGLIGYTQDGVFYGKNDGYYYQKGSRLQGYAVPTELATIDCKLTDVKAAPEEIPAVATTEIFYNMNLSASDKPPLSTPFDPTNMYTFNYTNIGSIYDSLGARHNISVYYVKSATPNLWTTYIYADGNSMGQGSLEFNSNGQLISATGMSMLSFNPGTGAESPQKISLQMLGSTQFGNPYNTTAIMFDGWDAGIYAANTIDDNGYISYFYNNGQTITFSKVAVFSL